MKRGLYFFGVWLALFNGPVARAQVHWGLVAGGSLVGLYPHQPHGPEPLSEYNPGTYSLHLTGLGGGAAETPLNKRWSLDASLSYDGNGAHSVLAVRKPVSSTTLSPLPIRRHRMAPSIPPPSGLLTPVIRSWAGSSGRMFG